VRKKADDRSFVIEIGVALKNISLAQAFTPRKTEVLNFQKPPLGGFGIVCFSTREEPINGLKN